MGSLVLQAVPQQLPVPATPQTFDRQELFDVQADPSCNVATHDPALQYSPARQSLGRVQLVRQLVASAQLRLPAQAVGVPTMQAPLPLQVLAVSVFPLQLGVPQAVAEG